MYHGNLMDFLSNLQRYLEKRYPPMYLRWEKRFKNGQKQNDKYFIVFGKSTFGNPNFMVANIHDDNVEDKIYEYINKRLEAEGAR